MNSNVSVIIPIYKPGIELANIITSLNTQTIKPVEIILIHTDVGDNIDFLKRMEGVKILSIQKKDFDHGKTRNFGASKSAGDYILFMTQDAIPNNNSFIENLLKPFDDEQVAVTFARQLPRKDCDIIEAYTRSFNYPDTDIKKTIKDKEKLGIKTIFLSDVAAMYKKETFNIVGGFPNKVLFNEDSIIGYRLLEKGYAIYYASKAEVIHSHNFTLKKQFNRYFDIGASQKMFEEIFKQFPSMSTGKSLVKNSIKYALSKGKIFKIFSIIALSGDKLIGFKIGNNYKRLPKKIIKGFTLQKAFWK